LAAAIPVAAGSDRNSIDTKEFIQVMKRTAARLILTAGLVLGALCGSPARAQATPVWTEKMSEGFVSLNYGSLESEQPILQLSCFNEMEIAVLNIFGEIEGARPGQKLTIELSAGGAKAALDGEATLDDKSGTIFAEASGIEVKPVLAVLEAKGPIAVKTGESSQTLTDVGRAEAVERFSKDCTLQ
jgi:hypothetical protein